MAAQRHGVDRPGLAKQQAPPPPGLEHPGTSGGGCPQDWNIRGGTSNRRQREPQRGHENEAEEMQQSRVEDEAGEKQRRQDEDKAKVTQ